MCLSQLLSMSVELITVKSGQISLSSFMVVSV